MSAMNFSERVRSHPDIHAFQPQPGGPLVLSVKDQILACRSVSQRVKEFLFGHHLDPVLIGSLFDDSALVPGNENVDAYRIQVSPEQFDIVDVVRRVRIHLGADHEHKASPNHVLIPAMNESHGCPWDGPKPYPHSPTLPVEEDPRVPVTVIDSGYQWEAAWGKNPLDDHAPVAHSDAEWLGVAGWNAGYPDELDVDGDGLMDALAGHANFVAGVVAQSSPHAKITIVNHNGGFGSTKHDFPTEAAVARSLGEVGDAKVVNLGFAFNALDGMSSCAWEVALKQIEDGGAIVIVPAGNQDSTGKRWPAALAGAHPNIIGVASIDKPDGEGKTKRSTFSNHGDWVAASAIGRGVVSTFLRVKAAPEDDPANTRGADGKKPDSVKVYDFKTGWARWNGTSFAAPRVVAAIAEKLADLPSGTSAKGAWDAVAGAGKPDPAKQLGVVLDGGV